ncbi:hypothetical protein ACFVU3_36300 [Streptomyces sp. NPDC058052]|uniref:hypothetical protein n=1 Tax=Streptomyces sp. NPDC058052 TaxID=3346316 RepID=UPI0036E53081
MATRQCCRQAGVFVDVVAETVKILVAMAVGAATEVGAESARQVTDLARRRLAVTEGGRTALDGLDSQPAAPESASALDGELRRETAADPDFEAQLRNAMTGDGGSQPSLVTHSVQIGGRARLKNSPISLGPITITNSPVGWATVVIVVVAVAVLLVLAVDGRTRLLDSGAPSQPSQPPGGPAMSQTAVPSAVSSASDDTGAGSDPVASSDAGGVDGPTRDDLAPLVSEASVLTALPGIDDLPAGWVEIEAPWAQQAEPQDSDRLNASFVARAKYSNGSTALTRFLVYAYSDQAAAEAGYSLIRSRVGKSARAASMASVGDESFAYKFPNGPLVSVMRSATVVVEVSGSGSNGVPYAAEDMEAMAQLMQALVLSAQLGLSH